MDGGSSRVDSTTVPTQLWCFHRAPRGHTFLRFAHPLEKERMLQFGLQLRYNFHHYEKLLPKLFDAACQGFRKERIGFVLQLLLSER